MNLGGPPSLSINHALRIFNHVPLGAFKSPSITYRVPKVVFSSRVTSLSIACCFKASASSSHRSGPNPNSIKKEALLLPARWVVESKYLTTLASGISAFSTYGSFISNSASNQSPPFEPRATSTSFSDHDHGLSVHESRARLFPIRNCEKRESEVKNGSRAFVFRVQEISP